MYYDIACFARLATLASLSPLAYGGDLLRPVLKRFYAMSALISQRQKQQQLIPTTDRTSRVKTEVREQKTDFRKSNKFVLSALNKARNSFSVFGFFLTSVF